MWVDEHGVFHTVSLPDPTVLMTPQFLESLERLLVEKPDEVAEALELEEQRFFREHAAGPSSRQGEAEFEVATPPENLLTEPVQTVEDLVSRFRDIDKRWRLDVLVAIDEFR